MERTFLQWNTTNWITVVLMVTLGYFLIGGVAQILHNFTPRGGMSDA